jgi:diguanylate cyclase (GGDEF)-like protein/PAS domain S-box-containing protein
MATSQVPTINEQHSRKLEQNRVYVNTVLDTIAALVVVLDRDGRILRFNRACEELTGYSADEVIGKHPWDLFLLPEEADGVRTVFRNLGAGRFPNTYENHWQTKSGEPRLIAWSNSALLDDKGGVEFVIPTGIDITEQRRAEADLRRHLDHLEETIALRDYALIEAAADLRADRDERAQLEYMLRHAAVGVSTKTGEHFFQSLVQYLGETLGVDYAFVGELSEQTPNRIISSAVFAHGQIVDNIEYDLAGTPCANVVGRQLCAYPANVQALFPEDHLLVEMGVEGYLGTPLFDQEGCPSGILVVLHSKPLQHVKLAESLTRIFAARAAAELDRLRAERSRRREQERALITLRCIGDAVLSADASGAIEYLNPVAERLTGWTTEQARGRMIHEICPLGNESGEGIVSVPLQATLQRGASVSLTEHTVLVTRDGSRLPVDLTANPILSDSFRVIGAVVVFRDASTPRRRIRELARRATRDSLTGLVNRHTFEQKLADTLSKTGDGGTGHVLCYLDLDRFKVINDECGHAAGDALLCQLSRRLQSVVRQSDTLARLGGDEFALLLEDCTLDTARQIADDLLRCVADFRFTWNEKIYFLGISIGLVSTRPYTHASHDALLQLADAACYTAKREGRNRIHVHSRDEPPAERYRFEERWIALLSGDEMLGRLRLHAQAVVAASEPHASPVQHEILLRILDRRGHPMLPGAFLPVVERRNRLPAIDRWVIANALRWHADAAPGDSRVSVNVSGPSLADRELPLYIEAQLKHFRIPADRLCIEIDEATLLAQFDRAYHFSQKVKALGCGITLDGFGRGACLHTSINQLPLDYLKVDGVFLRESAEDPVKRITLDASCQIARLLNIRTIGTMVETEADVHRVQNFNLDYAQGFAIGRPFEL